MSDDVVVVGAGFSGLCAAGALEQAGLRVTVVEARPRVGGKVESELDGLGRRIDSGGQFVCDDMPEVLHLIERSGGRLVPADHGRNGLGLAGDDSVGAALDGHQLWEAFAEAERTFAHLAHLPDVPVGDHPSLDDWFASLGLAQSTRRAAVAMYSGVMCTDIADIPLAHAIDLTRRTPLTGEELQYVVAGTLHDVADQLAASLRQPPLLATPVQAIEVGERSVAVITDAGTIAAAHVVLAVPPSALIGIAFTPPLPARVAAAASAFRPGSVMKFMLRYSHPFWQHDDLGPTRTWLSPAGLYVGDASIDGDAMLVAFLGGPVTSAWRSLGAAQRRRTLLALLVDAYGPAAGEPLSIVERDWAPDQWGGGGYWNVLVDDEQRDAVEVLRAGAPGITFASTELAPSFPGYVEGAITAGRAAAERVLRALGLVCQSDEP